MISSEQSAYESVRSLSAALLFENIAVFHHEFHDLERFHIGERIALHRDDVSKCSGRDYAKIAFHIQKICGGRSRRLNGVHRRHTELYHQAKFIRDRLSPGN